MILSSADPAALDEIFDRAIEQNPHAGEILKAFKPIITLQRRLVAETSLKAMDSSRLDQEKLKAGVPVIRQLDLLHTNEDLKQITLDLAEAAKKSLPGLAQWLEHFCDLIQKDKIRPADYFKASDNRESKTAEGGIKDPKEFPSNASFIMNLVSRVILQQRAAEIIKAAGALVWEKGYCPICGDFPSIALIEEEGAKRFLHCSSCGYDWPYTRVVCPYCEDEAPQGMDYFYIENKTQEAAFICDHCKKYLVTLYRVGHLLARDMDVSAIALVHLDMIMQGKGYKPMTTCFWNVLK